MADKTTVIQSQVVLGKNIKIYREKSGFTQESLAEKLDISVQHLSNIERGRRFVTAELLDRIAEIFVVPLSDLFIEIVPSQSSKHKVQAKRITAIIDNELLEFAVTIKKRIIDSL